MKAIVSITIFALAFCGRASTIELNEAIRLKKVVATAHYSSLGRNGIQLKVTNKTAEELSLVVPRGTTFSPSNIDEQILMTVESQLIALKASEQKSATLHAYCTQLSHSAPSLDATFKIGKTSSEKLLSLLSFIKDKPVNPANYQDAIWAITDKEDIGNISPTTKNDQELRAFIAKLTNQKDPWYSKEGQTTAHPGQPIQRSSVSVKGELNFTLKEDTKFILEVVDVEGKQMMRFPGDRFIEKNTEYTYRINISVEGWPVGTYHVQLRNNKDQSKLKAFDFKV